MLNFGYITRFSDGMPVFYWTDENGLHKDDSIKPRLYVDDSVELPENKKIQIKKHEYFLYERVEKTDLVGVRDSKLSPVKIVYVTHPSVVPVLRDMLPPNTTYEADVKFELVCAVEKGLKPSVSGRKKCYLDIEVLMPFISEKRILEAVDPIFLIGCEDNNAYHAFYCPVRNIEPIPGIIMHPYANEKVMLTSWIAWMAGRRYDDVIGWNSSGAVPKDQKNKGNKHSYRRGFDIPYILTRCERLGVDYRLLSPVRQVYTFSSGEPVIGGVCLVDLLYWSKFSGKIKHKGLRPYNWKLDTVARYVGEKKVEHEESLEKLWEEDPIKVIEYNRQDVHLTKKIDEKYRITQDYSIVANLSGIQPQYSVYSTRVYDQALRHLTKGRWVFPTRVFEDTDAEKAIGADVFDPVIGLHHKVWVFDFSALYPSIIIAYNIGIDTLDPKGAIRPPILAHFKGEWLTPYTEKTRPRFVAHSVRRSVIAQLVQTFKKLRKDAQKDASAALSKFGPQSREYEIADALQYNIKPIINSCYGCMGYPGGRLYDKRLVNAITITGQNIVRMVKRLLEKDGYTVVFGDTDSVGVVGLKDEDVEKYEKKINEAVDKAVLFAGGEPGNIKIEAEKHGDILLVPLTKKTKNEDEKGAKKHYILHLDLLKGHVVDDYDYKGIQAVRSNTSSFCVEAQKLVIKKIFEGKNPTYIIQKWIKNMSKVPLEYLLERCPIRRNIEDYKGKPQNLQAIIASNLYLKKHFTIGDSPMKAILKYPLPNESTVIAIDKSSDFERLASRIKDNGLVGYRAELDLEHYVSMLRAVTESLLTAAGYEWPQPNIKVKKQASLFEVMK